MIEWIEKNRFSIDNVNFTLDYEHGGSKRGSQYNNFTMMKAPNFLKQYMALKGTGIRKILELGVYQGGSFVYMDKLLQPDKISAVELSTVPIPALDQYVLEQGGRCKIHYGTSQSDVEALERIVDADFAGQVDLVVDDASHFYELTKISFKTLFPKLRPGGTYIIEDCFWSFEGPYQAPDHPWFDQPSLANILIDLAEELCLNNAVEHVHIGREMMIIKKMDSAHTGPIFEGQGLRGRHVSLI